MEHLNYEYLLKQRGSIFNNLKDFFSKTDDNIETKKTSIGINESGLFEYTVWDYQFLISGQLRTYTNLILFNTYERLTDFDSYPKFTFKRIEILDMIYRSGNGFDFFNNKSTASLLKQYGEDLNMHYFRSVVSFLKTREEEEERLSKVQI